MKKLLTASTVVIPVALTSISLASCEITTSKINNKNENDISIPKKEPLYKNHYINEMLNFYTNNNNNHKKNYISLQENKSNTLFDELKFSLTYYPIFISNRALNNRHQYQTIINKAKDAIQKHLSADWYWTINNLSHFWFIFSPYGDLYKKIDKEKELYEQVHNELGSWIARIQNNNPEKLLKFKFPEAKEIISKWVDKNKNDFKSYDPEILNKKSISNIESWYLIFDSNKAIKILKYIENDKPKLQILTDLLIFKNSENIEEQITKIENEISSKRESDLTKAIEKKNEEEIDDKKEENDSGKNLTSRNVNSNADTETIAKLKKEIDLSKILESVIKLKGDKEFFEFHATHQYNQHFVDAIDTINKNELSVYRFTIRNIDNEN
ncbi:aromatic motif membrane protein [Mycoplasmopsis bovis]|uniref:aromatic motif membrane protein n=1 Tax=Mycoplasmopsis bovis TaxID=28903 RepID=UPI003D28A735